MYLHKCTCALHVCVCMCVCMCATYIINMYVCMYHSVSKIFEISMDFQNSNSIFLKLLIKLLIIILLKINSTNSGRTCPVITYIKN